MFSWMLILLFTVMTCFADNPIVQTIYTADPAPMVYNGRVYVYTTHDEDVTVNNFFTMNDWRCYSSTDMVNWTDHGKVLSYTDFSWAKGDAWAGQCIYRNGKFYFYVPINQKNGGNAIGVAVSDSPTGPFKDAIGRPLAAGYGYIDPTVYIDSDGQAYLYWGNPNLWYVKLNQDMISYSGNINQITLTTASFGVRSNTDRPTSYEEGPWFYKRNNLYYMIFTGGPISEHIAYSTSTGPTGPWTYRGKIMPTQGGSFTNHSGVVDFNGNSYFFYHNGALPGGGGFKRSVCVEKFTYNADGTIPTINMTTTGAPQSGTLNPYGTIQAETICWESGIETESCSEGGLDVCNIENGDYIKVKGVDFGNGAVSFEARVASATSGGNIEIRMNSSTGTLVGTCAVSGTGGWQTWVTKTCTISGASGVHDLYFRFTGGSGSLFNINWWKFNGSGIATPTPPPVTPTPVRTPTPTPTLTPVPGTPTPTPIRTGTPIVTPTKTPGPVTPTPGTGSIKVQFYNQSKTDPSNQLYLNFQLVNTSSSAVALSNVKIRYWYTQEGTQAQTFWCDYTPLGSSNVTGSFVKMGTAKTGADTYLEIGFTSGAGNLAAGASTQVQCRCAKSDWSNYTQSNDYSFNSSATSYTDWTKVTGYVSGAMAWGVEP
jgi:hypothetical protein